MKTTLAMLCAALIMGGCADSINSTDAGANGLSELDAGIRYSQTCDGTARFGDGQLFHLRAGQSINVVMRGYGLSRVVRVDINGREIAVDTIPRLARGEWVTFKMECGR